MEGFRKNDENAVLRKEFLQGYTQRGLILRRQDADEQRKKLNCLLLSGPQVNREVAILLLPPPFSLLPLHIFSLPWCPYTLEVLYHKHSLQDVLVSTYTPKPPPPRTPYYTPSPCYPRPPCSSPLSSKIGQPNVVSLACSLLTTRTEIEVRQETGLTAHAIHIQSFALLIPRLSSGAFRRHLLGRLQEPGLQKTHLCQVVLSKSSSK